MTVYSRNLILFFLLLFLSQSEILAQDILNQYDKQGNRHGYWKEYYDSDKQIPKYEGEFSHGEEIGLFKFYKQGLKQPTAVINFDRQSDSVTAKYLSQSGKTISEGKLLEKERVGLWTYYHKNSDKVMMTENYRGGKLHGLKKVFYENGALAEEADYTNGELHGNRKLYSVKGIVLEDLQYRNGELHGPAKFYNGKGELMSEGFYRNNKHHGTWRHYENEKLKEEKEY